MLARVDGGRGLNQETLNIIMSSPVLVAIVTAAASAVMSKVAQKPNSEQRDRRETERNEDHERISEIHKISKGLDRHINNNEVPFRQQVNEKLDSMSSTVEALLETSKSTNMTMRTLTARIDVMESDVNHLESDVRNLKNEHEEIMTEKEEEVG